MKFHQSILVPQLLALLNPQPKKIYIDATLGHGGHSLAILKKGGIVYGIEADPINLKIAKNRIKSPNFYPILGNHKNLLKIISKHIHRSQNIGGVIFDLGLCQNQITSNQRGFSFHDSHSLDMRLNPQKQKVTAQQIINTASVKELFQIFSKYGQEKYSQALAEKIVSCRRQHPITTSKQLSDIISRFYQTRHLKTKLHPATKIFLSLHLAVNQELENLAKVLPQTLHLPSKTIVCFISFHSGQDRLVKKFIRQNSPHQITVLTPKPIRPTPQQINQNPSSRSALLRSYKIN